MNKPHASLPVLRVLCRDLKEHFRRSAQQMESRRRKAVQEMMRQRSGIGSDAAQDDD